MVSGWHTNFDHYCRDYGIAWLSPLVTRRLRHFHNRCAGTLVPTHRQAEELTSKGFENVRVMARGIDGETFSPAHRSPELRASWDGDEHRPVALYVGRLAPEKNLDLLRDTFAAMLAARPEMSIVVVGDGPGKSSLEKALPDVRFTGFIDPQAWHVTTPAPTSSSSRRFPKPGAMWCSRPWPAAWLSSPSAMLPGPS